MSEKLTYNATGSVTELLLKTIFKDAPVHEMIGDKKGKIISGINGIVLYGGIKLGKTTDILKMFEMKCMYQKPYKGVRQIHVGVLRISNADFVSTLGKSFSYWYEEHNNKNFEYGFRVANQNTRPEITVRFPSLRYKMNDQGGVNVVNETDEHGNSMSCEIVYFCYAANKKDDEKKMKGGEFTDTWANEGNTTSREAKEMLDSRADRYPPNGATRSINIMDLNPTHKKSWEHIAYIQAPQKDVRVIKHDSALRFKPSHSGEHVLRGVIGDYVINEVATVHGDYSYFFNQLGKSETFIINNILGEYTNIVEGVVVHEGFDPSKVVMDIPAAANQTIMVCVDFGVKCGFVMFVQDDEGVMNQIHDGWTDRGFRNLYEGQIKPLLDKHYSYHVKTKNIVYIGDPRTGRKRDLINASTSVVLIEDDGYEYKVPAREDGAIIDSIDYRIDTVDYYLKNNMLVVAERCELTIDAYSFGYVRDDLTGRPHKVKSGKYAEIMDASQYGLTFVALGGEIEPSTQYHNANEKVYHAY